MGLSLLTPEKIKDDKRDAQLKTQRRDIGLAAEENRLVVSINLTRDAVEEQKIELAAELATFKADAAQEKADITAEIVKLTDQRRDLLKPIDEIRKNAESKLEAAVKREEAVGEAEKALVTRGTAVVEREQKVIAAEQRVFDRGLALIPKENELNDREKRIQSAATALSARQEEHYERVRVDDERINADRVKNTGDALINANERERQVKKEAELAEKAQEIESNYAALRMARDELGLPN